MDEFTRIDDLRRRVDLDPASIAFAQLAEEYRRAGRLEEAVAACHDGLAVHPNYLSARVTLGRALLQLGRLDDARRELQLALRGAPQNLAALRGLADARHRQGAFADALAHYREALVLAPDDPELERTVADVSAALTQDVAARARDRAARTVEALKQWITAIHVVRAQRHA